MARKEEAKAKAPEVQLVTFRLRDEEFGVEISQVREIVRLTEITHLPEAPQFIKGVINLRGEIIAVVDLGKQFGLSLLEKLEKTSRIIVVELGDKTVGMLVDEVPEVLKISKEDIEPTPEVIQSQVHEDYIKGVGKIGERLLILLDLEKILAPHEVKELEGITRRPEDG